MEDDPQKNMGTNYNLHGEQGNTYEAWLARMETP